MKSFSVLSLGAFIEDSGIELAFPAFANFYHSISSKNQTKVELAVIDDRANFATLKKQIEATQLEEGVRLYSIDEQDTIERLYQKSVIFFLPSRKTLNAITQEALSYSLPILCFDDSGQEEYINQTCGMLLDCESEGESILEFSRLLSMLYFDPEVQKILKKGAETQYEKHFTWKNNTRVKIRG